MDGKFCSFSLIAVASLLGLVLFQGTLGIFYLDDFSNLNRIELIDSQPNGLLAFLFADRIGPLGRPFSLLTFALQKNSWPDNPFDFKIINLLIHIANSILVIIISKLLLAKHILNNKNCFKISLLIGLLWALAPIQFTNVFYVVQRMNLLSSAFVLAAIYVYLNYRAQFFSLPSSKKTSIVVSFFFIITLSVFSKENGILVFCYLLIIESLLFHEYKASKKILLLLSTLVLIIFMIVAFSQYHSNGYHLRDFTLKERLLSQSRILYEYLSLIIFPDSSRLGLYHDDYIASKSLLEPISTLFCSVFFIMLLIIANLVKRRVPLFSLGIFWFFIGHSLESTVLSLELYFEHRNYLPSFGIWIACIGLVIHNWGSIKKYRRVLSIALCSYLIFIAYSAYYQSYLWGKPNLYAYQQAIDHPLSLRARYSLATALMKSGELKKAQDIIANHPQGNIDPEAIVRQWFAGCAATSADLMPTLSINTTINIQKWLMTINMLQKILEKPYCSESMRTLAYTSLQRLSASFHEREEFFLALGRYEHMINQPNNAFNYLQQAFKIKENLETAQILIELCETLQLDEEKKYYIQKYNALIDNRFLYRLIYKRHDA